MFLAGNHDHYFIERRREELLERELADGRAAGDPRSLVGADAFRWFLERRLEGVQIDMRYPTYTFGGVLCTHGHYLDFYASRDGAFSGRLLARLIWSIAVARSDQEPTEEDLEATTEILTGLLFTIAQLPNGTRAQRQTLADFQALEPAFRRYTAPVREASVLQTGSRSVWLRSELHPDRCVAGWRPSGRHGRWATKPPWPPRWSGGGEQAAPGRRRARRRESEPPAARQTASPQRPRYPLHPFRNSAVLRARGRSQP